MLDQLMLAQDIDAHDMLAQLIEAQLIDAQLIELHEADAHDMLAHDMEFHVGSFCAVVCHVSELNVFRPVSGSTEMNWSSPRFGLAVPSVCVAASACTSPTPSAPT